MPDMTEEELNEVAEGIREMMWFRENGHKLIEAMLNPTWPKREL